MSAARIRALLRAHNIRIRTDGGRILAESLYTLNGKLSHDWEDVTDWTPAELSAWLGY